MEAGGASKRGGKKSHLCVTLIHNKEEGNVEDIKKTASVSSGDRNWELSLKKI